MDQERFFGRIRSTLYGGSLKQISVDNIKVVFRYWDQKYSKNPQSQLAYIFATVLAEVGRNMNPVRETFATSDAQARARLKHKKYAQSTPPYGHAYYGRGYVQLTWKYNYESQEKKINVPLVQFPDLALSTDNAIQILVEGMMAGDFNKFGKGLGFYVNKKDIDFVNARRTVNVLDRASEIAGYAWKFLDALEYATSSANIASSLTGFDESLVPEATLLPSYEHMAELHASISKNPDGYPLSSDEA